jgi:hypothetical protein
MDPVDGVGGQRVWLLDPDATAGKAWGTISTVDCGIGVSVSWWTVARAW